MGTTNVWHVIPLSHFFPTINHPSHYTLMHKTKWQVITKIWKRIILNADTVLRLMTWDYIIVILKWVQNRSPFYKKNYKTDLKCWQFNYNASLSTQWGLICLLWTWIKGFLMRISMLCKGELKGHHIKEMHKTEIGYSWALENASFWHQYNHKNQYRDRKCQSEIIFIYWSATKIVLKRLDQHDSPKNCILGSTGQ